MPEADWLSLAGERGLFMLPEWMRVGPGTYGGGFRGSCAVLGRDDGGAPVVAAAAWLIEQACAEPLCRPDLILRIPEAGAVALFPVALAGGWYDSRVLSPVAEGRQPWPADVEGAGAVGFGGGS